MKKISSICAGLFLLLSYSGFAQETAIDKYFSSYLDDDRFTQVVVSSKMFGLFVNFEMDDPDEQELVETISKLKGLKIIAGDGIADAATHYKSAIRKPLGDMDELMRMKEENSELVFFIDEDSGIISELLMITHQGENLVILSLVGDVDLKQISELSKKMNIEGFEHLENIK